jgi:dienelactone hydrolase
MMTIPFQKHKLLILTDLWGSHQNDWLQDYIQHLEDKFEISIYDSCQLAEIPEYIQSESERHQHFVNGGIEIAVQNLLQKEKEIVSILAFSIGGTIAWKAALSGLKVNRLTALSSTRLRYETETPNCEIKLIYGELDSNQPELEWFQNKKIKMNLIEKQGHTFYREEKFINNIL